MEDNSSRFAFVSRKFSNGGELVDCGWIPKGTGCRRHGDVCCESGRER